VAVLFLFWHWEFIGEFLTKSGFLRPTDFLPNLSWGIITLLGGHLLTLVNCMAMFILVLATLEVDAIDAGSILDNLLLVPAILMLKINALEVVFVSHRKIINSITDPVSYSCTSLYSVGLLHHLILYVLHQCAHQLSHVEALTVLRLLDDSGAVFLVDVAALLHLLSVASLLLIGHTLVLINSALYIVTIILVFNFIHFIRSVVVLVDRLFIAPRTK